MKFKVGDRVKITPPEDYSDGPGYNLDMGNVLGDLSQTLTLSVKEGNRGWWRCVEDGSAWLWDERWMKKVNKFKGNK